MTKNFIEHLYNNRIEFFLLFQAGIIDQYYLLSDTFPSCENPLLLKVPDHAYKSCNRFNKESDNDFVIFSNGSVKVKRTQREKERQIGRGEERERERMKNGTDSHTTD